MENRDPDVRIECPGQRLVMSPVSEWSRLLASHQKPLPPGASWELPIKSQQLILGEAEKLHYLRPSSGSLGAILHLSCPARHCDCVSQTSPWGPGLSPPQFRLPPQTSLGSSPGRLPWAHSSPELTGPKGVISHISREGLTEVRASWFPQIRLFTSVWLH